MVIFDKQNVYAFVWLPYTSPILKSFRCNTGIAQRQQAQSTLPQLYIVSSGTLSQQ